MSTPSVRRLTSTIKSNIGKMFVEKQIPLRNTVDREVRISGVITGLSRTFGETVLTAIERDRDALTALEDGYFHSYDDGRNSGNFVIRPGSLQFDDKPSNESERKGTKFNMVVVEWQQ